MPTIAELNVLLPILTIVGTALVVLVADWFLPPDDPRPAAALSTIGLAIAGWLVWDSWGTPAAAVFTRVVTLPGGQAATAALLQADPFAVYVAATLVVIGLAVVLMSADYLARRRLARAEYFVLVLLATAGMMLLGLASDLVVLFLSLETFSIALYVLAGFVRGDRFSQEAALKYFVLGSLAAGFLLYGVALLYAATGTTDLSLIGQSLGSNPAGPASQRLAFTGLALLLVGLGFKVAIVPFHQWTPDVYQGAPTTVTAFMAAGTKVAAFAALIRVLWLGFGSAAATWVPLLGVLAVVTMLVGNLAALVQADLKRMLGYSAIAHGGYVLVAVVAGQRAGSAAALYYLLVYALMNLGAFGVLVAIGPIGTPPRDATTLQDLAGLARRHPALAVALTVFLLALVGLPPTAGFLGKWYIFDAAVRAGLAPLAVALVANSVLSAFYYLRPVLVMFAVEPVEQGPIEVPTASAVVVAVAAVVVGLAVVLSGPMVSGARAAAGFPPAVRGHGSSVGGGLFVAPPQLEK